MTYCARSTNQFALSLKRLNYLYCHPMIQNAFVCRSKQAPLTCQSLVLFVTNINYVQCYGNVKPKNSFPNQGAFCHSEEHFLSFGDEFYNELRTENFRPSTLSVHNKLMHVKIPSRVCRQLDLLEYNFILQTLRHPLHGVYYLSQCI